MLSNIYPEYNWVPWRFSHVPKGLRSDPQILSDAIDYIESHFSIKGSEDWYRISKGQLKSLGLGHLIETNGGLADVLEKAVPDANWDKSKFL